MNDLTKNVPKPPTEPKPPKYRTLIFAIIGICSAYFAVLAVGLAIDLYNHHLSAVARIEIISHDSAGGLAIQRGIDSYFSEDGDYMRILPNGENITLGITAQVFNRFGRFRSPRMNNHNRIIMWELDGLPYDNDNESYSLLRNAIGFFRLDLTDEYREIKIRVSSTRNADIYDTFTIIIDPSMTPTLPTEPPPTAEMPTPTPTPAPAPTAEISETETPRWAMPFSENISEILENNVDLLLANMADWDLLPFEEDYSLFRVEAGEFFETSIIAAVVARYPDEDDLDRNLYILQADENGVYTVRWQALGVSGGRLSGGAAFSDSFAGMTIANDSLTLHTNGGSTHRWGTIMTYILADDKLILSRSESFEFSTHRPGGIRRVFYPIEGLVEIRTDWGMEGDFDNLLLNEKRVPSRILAFDAGWEIRDFRMSNNDIIISEMEPPPSLPWLWDITFGEPEHETTVLTSAEALEIVQRELFPDMVQLPMPFSEEILGNFSKILGHDIPSHFFKNDEFIISYGGILPSHNIRMAERTAEIPVIHTILRRRIETGEVVTILLHESTLEIRENWGW